MTFSLCTILLNVDYKSIDKVLAKKLKETLPKLIFFQQMEYMQNRFINEGEFLVKNESLYLKA